MIDTIDAVASPMNYVLTNRERNQMNNDTIIAALAESFGETLRQWLTPDEFAEMKHRNESDPAYADKACASHDFCDANMAMAAAFHSCLGREPDVAGERDAGLWNAAWELARKHHLGMQP